MARKREGFRIHDITVGRFRSDLPLPAWMEADLERIRQKHEDAEGYIHPSDLLERNNECPE